MTFEEFQRAQTRRCFFRDCAGGLGTIALANLLGAGRRTGALTLPERDPLAPRSPHFAPKANNVIFLFMEGGPSQIDLFDPKPALEKWHGRPLPKSMTKDQQFAFMKPTAVVLASPRLFRPHGECGTEFSDWLPHTASHADDICLIRSMCTEAFNHHPAQLLLFTGSTQLDRPALGAWVIYGLGSESQNLPGFVVLTSGVGTGGGASNFSSGFLPPTCHGVLFQNSGEQCRDTGDVEIASRIASYELAFQMQMAVPDLLDFSSEPPSIREMYGVDREPTRPFAVNCLLARRMVERGVRCVTLMHASWDDHTELNRKLKRNCAITDRPTAALLEDLKQRGLLEETLVIWGGEFGRTPVTEIRKPDDVDNAGRDHHPAAYSMWMAGGGIKGGQVIGKTDEFCFKILEDRIRVHDLQATILHCLGFDHTRLTYRHMGCDFRLTDRAGKVINKLLV